MQTITNKPFDLAATVSAVWKNIGMKDQPKSLQSHQPTAQPHHPLDCGVLPRSPDMPTTRRRAAAPKPSMLSMISGSSWLISIVVVGLFNIGMNFQQFNEVKHTQEAQSAEQKQAAIKMTQFREDQVRGLEDVKSIKANIAAVGDKVQAIDGRVLVIERTFIEPAKRGK